MTEENDINVSRETFELLKQFEALILKWTVKINLISKSTIPDIWNRHIIDSLQIFQHAPSDFRTWLDLGSGGGLPGIVMAIQARERNPAAMVTLVESDQRKAAFLRTAIRELDLNAQVMSTRIEALPPQKADVLSARALSEMKDLLVYCDRHLDAKGCALFQKGENWRKEHEAAQSEWSYQIETIKSETNPSAAVLKVKDIKQRV